MSSPAGWRARLRALVDREGLSGAAEWHCFERLLEGRQSFHSALIRLLAHLDYEEREAEEHWKAVCRQRKELTRRLGRDPGLEVALLDYFLNIRHVLRNPTVVEMAFLEATERCAVTDGLTGLFNRRYLQTSLMHEIQRSHRHGLRFSLAMLDVDGFKNINDCHGHEVGDELLIGIANVIQRNLRGIDVPCRYGGDEFALLLAGTERQGALVVADRIRSEVKQFLPVRAVFRPVPRLTLSGGIAVYPDDAPGGEKLLRRADEALYRAKRGGRDRISVGGDESQSEAG